MPFVFHYEEKRGAGAVHGVLFSHSGNTSGNPNVSLHHHFYYVDSGELLDIPASALQIDKLPDLPLETEVERCAQEEKSA